MRTTNSRLRDTAACLFLIAGFSFSTVAHGGQGVWTTNGPYGGEITALAIDPANPATLYAGANGGGVFKSADGGANWAAVSMGLTGVYVFALAIDPADPATLYAGADAGVFKSTDSGASWTVANLGLTIPDVSTVAIDPMTPATLYAGTSGGGVFKSTDSGASWTAANTGLTNLAVNSLAIDPRLPKRSTPRGLAESSDPLTPAAHGPPLAWDCRTTRGTLTVSLAWSSIPRPLPRSTS